jgi:hypothetical protein
VSFTYDLHNIKTISKKSIQINATLKSIVLVIMHPKLIANQLLVTHLCHNTITVVGVNQCCFCDLQSVVKRSCVQVSCTYNVGFVEDQNMDELMAFISISSFTQFNSDLAI